MKPRLGRLGEPAIEAARRRLTETGRTQIADLLAAEYADHLYRNAAEAEYRVVTLRGREHVDMPAAWLESLDLSQRAGLGQVIQASAQDDFQYLFDNLPIFDLAASGQAGPVWADLVAFLNSDAFLGAMRSVTGEPGIAMADAQVTRYRRGHFLTEHSDHAEGKARYFAYVLGLTPRWRIDWGGLLAFHSEDGNVAEAFTPRFNTLSLFRVPSPHSVTQVALSAGADRISVTGWLRGES